MKAFHIIRISLPLILGAVLLQSCDDEPAVGTPLNPVTKDNYGAKVYIYQSGAKTNTTDITVVQTPVNIILPPDTIDVYVNLTAPAQQDVPVSLTPDEAAAAAYGDNTTALPAAAINVINPTVAIKAGEYRSTEPVHITLKDDDALKAFQGQGVAILKLSTTSKEVTLAKEYNKYKLLINKITTNLRSQSKAELAKLTKIDINNYRVEVNGYETTDLNDNNTSTAYDNYGPYEVVMQLDKPHNISGLSYQFGYDSPYYSPLVIEILTSDDGTKWTSQTNGEVNDSYGPSSSTDVVPWVFYSTVKCKYVKLRCVKCPYGVWYGNDYNMPALCEVNLYE